MPVGTPRNDNGEDAAQEDPEHGHPQNPKGIATSCLSALLAMTTGVRRARGVERDRCVAVWVEGLAPIQWESGLCRVGRLPVRHVTLVG